MPFAALSACHVVSVLVIRSPLDGRLFLAYPQDSGTLPQSFDRLQFLDDGGNDLVSVSRYFFVIFLEDSACCISNEQFF